MKNAKLFQAKKNYVEFSALILQICKFLQIPTNLQIPKIQDLSDIRINHDPVLAAINTFQNHPSAVNIKQREFNSTFNFKNTNENEVRKIIKNMNLPKTCQGSVTFPRKSKSLI